MYCQGKRASVLSGQKGLLDCQGKRTSVLSGQKGLLDCQGKRVSVLSGQKDRFTATAKEILYYESLYSYFQRIILSQCCILNTHVYK